MDLESRKIETANLTMVVPPELSALDLLKGASADKLYFKPEKADPSLDPFMPIPRNVDFSIPLDGSKAKAPSEFISLTPNSSKAGVDGVIETIKDKWNGVFGERDTLHDHVRMLARAGMTPSERQQLAKEEQQIKDYNQANGSSLLGRYDRGEGPPKTPMLDELNRRTTALEHNIAETAKKGMTPLQIAQLESGQFVAFRIEVASQRQVGPQSGDQHFLSWRTSPSRHVGDQDRSAKRKCTGRARSEV